MSKASFHFPTIPCHVRERKTPISWLAFTEAQGHAPFVNEIPAMYASILFSVYPRLIFVYFRKSCDATFFYCTHCFVQ